MASNMIANLNFRAINLSNSLAELVVRLLTARLTSSVKYIWHVKRPC